MKMHHLDKEKVETIMQRVKEVIESGEYPPDKIEEIFKLSEVDGEKFLEDQKTTRLNSSHKPISYAVFCLKKKNREKKE